MPFILKAHVVEDKELGFRTEIDRIGDARGLQIILSPMANAAWVKPVAFSGDRINDIGNQAQSLFVHEGIDPVAVRIRHQQHVRFVDRRPAAQTGTVKAEPVLERLFGKLVDRERQVMPGPDQISETNIDVGRLFIGRKLQHIIDTHKYSSFSVTRKLPIRRGAADLPAVITRPWVVAEEITILGNRPRRGVGSGYGSLKSFSSKLRSDSSFRISGSLCETTVELLVF